VLLTARRAASGGSVWARDYGLNSEGKFAHPVEAGFATHNGIVSPTLRRRPVHPWACQRPALIAKLSGRRRSDVGGKQSQTPKHRLGSPKPPSIPKLGGGQAPPSVMLPNGGAAIYPAPTFVLSAMRSSIRRLSLVSSRLR
jgi:hypothetical protein